VVEAALALKMTTTTEIIPSSIASPRARRRPKVELHLLDPKILMLLVRFHAVNIERFTY
jgi:hypothetical protein